MAAMIVIDWAVVKAWLLIGSAVPLGAYLAWRTRRWLDRDKNQLVQRNPYKR